MGKRQLNEQQLLLTIKQLLNVLKIAPSTSSETDFAINTANPDFEDALQYASAVSVNADCILTRNEKHFRYSAIPVMTASQFLISLN